MQLQGLLMDVIVVCWSCRVATGVFTNPNGPMQHTFAPVTYLDHVFKHSVHPVQMTYHHIPHLITSASVDL